MRNIGSTPFKNRGEPGHASKAPEIEPNANDMKIETPTRPRVQGILSKIRSTTVDGCRINETLRSPCKTLLKYLMYCR